MGRFGRHIIYTDAPAITRDNVVQVVNQAAIYHAMNASDAESLYNYYRGDQPILQRVKDVRPEICNRIVENRAYEIVTFYTSFLLGEPVQYVSRNDSVNAEELVKLNDFMYQENKAAKDKTLADWFHICGTAYRIALPRANPAPGEPPFQVFDADPRATFVVYSSQLGHEPMMGVYKCVKVTGEITFSCYTKDRFYEVVNGKITRDEPLATEDVPIIEYSFNNARLGAFEVVQSLLDAINTVESNSVDDIEQIVQSLLLFHNVGISSDKYDELRERGALRYADIDPEMKGEVKYISSPLNPSQPQAVIDHLYQSVLTICGMPNRNGGTSTSDTGSAVLMRDGFTAAEARAKDTEMRFRESEMRFLRIVCRLCEKRAGMHLKASDINVQFPRRNYENMLQKAQILDLMLNNDKIAPKYGFELSGMFPDPDLACRVSEEYYEAHMRDANCREGDREDSPAGQSGRSQDREGTGNRDRDKKAAPA